MKRIIALSLFTVHFALAEEYAERMARLSKISSQIDQRMRSLGIPVASSKQDSTDADHPQKIQLFTIHTPLAEQKSPAGKLLFGTLYNRLIVGSEPSPVVVELLDGQGIFSGLRALGMARQSSTPERVQVEITKLILRGGKAVTLAAVALDEAGASGLRAAVFSSKAWQVAGAMGASFISGLAATSQSTQTSQLGYTSVQPTGRNAMLGGLAQTAADQSKRLIDDATKEKPVLVVEAGTELTVFLSEELRF